MSHISNPEQIAELADWMFGYVENGLKVNVNQTFSLKEASQAHRALEGRKTSGSTILTP